MSSNYYYNEAYTCDPVPAASMNKGDFQFACQGLRGKDMGSGFHTISWNLPAAAGVSIGPNRFFAMTPSSTPTYVVNTALATTTYIPEVAVAVDGTTTSTMTVRSTSTVKIPTGTSICTFTLTVTPPPGPGRRLRRTGVPDLDSAAVVADHIDAGRDLDLLPAHGHHGSSSSSSSNGNDTAVDLEQRAAAAPTIGRPDHTYPPYGASTVYVSSISTSTWTRLRVIPVYKTLPETTTTTTISYLSVSSTTVTVTASAPSPPPTAVEDDTSSSGGGGSSSNKGGEGSNWWFVLLGDHPVDVGQRGFVKVLLVR